MKLFLFTALALVTLFVFTGCTATTNSLVHTSNSDGDIAGFWLGIWHGLIAPITFVISLFTDAVGIYEAHNNGSWYNFGFMLGLLMSLKGSCSNWRCSSK